MIPRPTRSTHTDTLFPYPTLFRYKKVDSTNNYAKVLLANSGPVTTGTVILADEQSGGRGQGNARWLSEPEKNLTFSLILHNDFLSPADQFYLNMAVSLGVVEGLSALLPTPPVSSPSSPMKSPERDLGRIKWPNDIFFGQRKVGEIGRASCRERGGQYV